MAGVACRVSSDGAVAQSTQARHGLVASRTLLCCADGDAPVVRVINVASSSEIAAQGGTADFMVQMVLPSASDNSSSNSSSSATTRRLRVSPGIASVFLNGECLCVSQAEAAGWAVLPSYQQLGQTASS